MLMLMTCYKIENYVHEDIFQADLDMTIQLVQATNKTYR